MDGAELVEVGGGALNVGVISGGDLSILRVA